MITKKTSKKKYIARGKFILAFAFFISIFICTLVNTGAESLSPGKEAEDLTIYEGGSGFYEVPMSTNAVPAGEKTIAYPTLAITDTLVLRDNSSRSIGLSIYKLSTGSAILHAEIGDGHESTYDVKSLGVGDFTAIKTTHPFACSELTLLECKSSSGYIGERLFSVTLDGISQSPDISNNATSTGATSTAAKGSILDIASTTDLVETVPEPAPTLIVDTINPAKSTLVLPEDTTPGLNLDLLYKNTVPVVSESEVQSDQANPSETTNADF